MPATTAASPASQLTLPAYYWRLASATDSSGKPIAALQKGIEQQLRLTFSGDAMNIRGGCNAQFGGYRYKDGVLHVNNLASHDESVRAKPDAAGRRDRPADEG